MTRVDIVVCVHNALDDVRACLEAVQRTDYDTDLLTLQIVDDGSEAPTATYVQGFVEQTPWAKLHRRDEAGGYTIAANTGAQAAQGDIVVLLNSDTIVPAKWLRKIVATFNKSDDIGLVGPLSNAASWQSVPKRSRPGGGWIINELPMGATIDDMDALVQDVSPKEPPLIRLPLLNGFCLAIRRKVFDDIGWFDEAAFPRGFGEEDDFCLRATVAGYGIALAPDTYVYHAKSKSYGSTRRDDLTRAGQNELRRKHGSPRLERAVETMRLNPYLAQIRARVSDALLQLETAAPAKADIRT